MFTRREPRSAAMAQKERQMASDWHAAVSARYARLAAVGFMLLLVSCPHPGDRAQAPQPAARQAPSTAPSPRQAPTARPTAAPTVAPTVEPTVAPTITVKPTATPLPTPSASATPELTGTALLEARLLEIINAIRAQSGLVPYRPDLALSAAARAHSCDMAANGFIGHDSSDGRSVAERMPPAAPPWVWPSESIAAGSDDPQVIVDMWMDEPPEGWHRRNILDGEQQAIGVGYCFREDDPTGNRHYWTIDVTRPGQ
jgi:uncharacterized protein YkwD